VIDIVNTCNIQLFAMEFDLVICIPQSGVLPRIFLTFTSAQNKHMLYFLFCGQIKTRPNKMKSTQR